MRGPFRTRCVPASGTPEESGQVSALSPTVGRGAAVPPVASYTYKRRTLFPDGRAGRMLTINVALLLAVILFLLLFRPVQARSRGYQTMVVVIAVVLGVLIAPTGLGQGILNGMAQLSQGISNFGH
ncbi:hypothetical protein GCM10010361_71040 [Streptomyces olivaceiscleroticus]|uniref:Uncharacterized protein n=2 Tax=Streptomyces TaxID=1883 RepID=A0ABN1BDR4_9ACTN